MVAAWCWSIGICAGAYLTLQLFEQIQGLQRGQAVGVELAEAVDDALRERGEDGELQRRGGVFGFERDVALLGFFVLREDAAGALDDGGGQAGEARDFDAVALAGGAGLDGVQEGDAGGRLL